MSTPASDIQFAELPWKGRTIRIEYQWIGEKDSDFPVIVFLHEGLGSIAMWKDFPARFCREHGFTGLVFSRYGYGQSTSRPMEEHLAPSYLHEQAHQALPAILSTLNVQRPWLFGHSDGASIALLYAAHFPQQVSGIVVMAPHIFVEDVTIDGIRKARDAFEQTDLRHRLARYHADPVSVFFGWNDAWLNPAFRDWNIEQEIRSIICPVLAMQGEDDEYGTLKQIRDIENHVPSATAIALAECGHSPHRDQAQIVGSHTAAFIKGANGG